MRRVVEYDARESCALVLCEAAGELYRAAKLARLVAMTHARDLGLPVRTVGGALGISGAQVWRTLERQ